MLKNSTLHAADPEPASNVPLGQEGLDADRTKLRRWYARCDECIQSASREVPHHWAAFLGARSGRGARPVW